VQVSLANVGDEPATNVSATVSHGYPFSTIPDNAAQWPDIASGAAAMSLPNHFTIQLQPWTPMGTRITCLVDVTADGYTTRIPFALNVGVEKALVISDGSGSASTIAAFLGGLGYVVVEETAAASNPATWTSYAFIVWSTGGNLSPISQSSYRSDLEAYVATGAHLWIEGGEIGYDAADTPGYPSFAANVLHATNWVTDSSGDITVVASSHPLVTTPHALPSAMTCGYSGWGDQDAMDTSTGGVRIASWTGQPNQASIIAVDPDGNPGNGGQIVYTCFDFVELDAASQAPLVGNIADWLGRLPTPTTRPQLLQETLLR